MTVGEDPFFQPEFEPVSQAELHRRWEAGTAERVDRVHHLVMRLAGMVPPFEGTPADGAAWALQQVTTDGSKGLVFRLDSVLSRLLETEHARLHQVVRQVRLHDTSPEALVRALLIEIHYEGD